MFRLDDQPEYVQYSTTISSIGYNVTTDELLASVIEGKRGYNTYMKLKLKNSVDMVPIVNAINSSVRTSTIDKDRFVKDTLRNTSSLLAGSSTTLESSSFKNELDEKLGDFYNFINEKYRNDYSNAIVINMADHMNKQVRIDNQQKILLSKNFTSYTLIDRSIILGTFYYVYNDKILLTLMVKKDFVYQFRENLKLGFIDPSHTEIWVDKSLLDESDRRKLNKWIREVLMMKLVMSGFKIVEKDDIISELIYFPKIKFKTPSEIAEFRAGLNKMFANE